MVFAREVAQRGLRCAFDIGKYIYFDTRVSISHSYPSRRLRLRDPYPPTSIPAVTAEARQQITPKMFLRVHADSRAEDEVPYIQTELRRSRMLASTPRVLTGPCW